MSGKATLFHVQTIARYKRGNSPYRCRCKTALHHLIAMMQITVRSSLFSTTHLHINTSLFPPFFTFHAPTRPPKTHFKTKPLWLNGALRVGFQKFKCRGYICGGLKRLVRLKEPASVLHDSVVRNGLVV